MVEGGNQVSIENGGGADLADDNAGGDIGQGGGV